MNAHFLRIQDEIFQDAFDNIRSDTLDLDGNVYLNPSIEKIFNHHKLLEPQRQHVISKLELYCGQMKAFISINGTIKVKRAYILLQFVLERLVHPSYKHVDYINE
jgi:hypothetical protein